jgi:hypothetical protein
MKLREIIKEISNSHDKMASTLPVLSLNQPGVEHCDHAGIANELFKKADRDVKNGTKIFVTGNDGPNLDGAIYKAWLETLRLWLDRGAEVTYFLLDPSPKALKSLFRLTAEKQEWKLRVYSLKKSLRIPAQTRQMLKEWRTTHFAVFENPAQFWLESRHEPQNTHAEDCYFFPRKVAEKSSLPQEYKQRFELVLHQCGKPLFANTNSNK